MVLENKPFPFKKAPVVKVGRRLENDHIQKSHLEFLFELYTDGISLSKDQYQLLVDNEFISTVPDSPQEYIGPKSPTYKGKYGRDRSFERAKKERLAAKKDNIDVILKPILETEIKNEDELVYDVEPGVRKIDWAPNSIIHHSPKFVEWIDSVNAGFNNRISYERFERYKMQSEEWMEGGHTIDDYEEEEERYEYMIRELKRCSINSLYAANKYYWLKDEAGDIGRLKYFATEHYEHQRICAYLFDCGYSMIIGKPRQPGITSIFGILGMNRVLGRKNYFLKFIAENTTTSEEIFEDKIKFSFYSLDGWFQPSTAGKPDVLNDRDRLFKIGRKGQKGKIEGLNSKIVVTAPYKTAINGGSPPLVFIDEIGSIDILTEMINEGRPTMFKRNRATGEFEIKGQICAWGCVCAGTKVWTNNGDLINIEDLIPEQGILGYDYKKGMVSKEKITYWQPPKDKECYRITTNTGRELECSHDHPVLWSKSGWGITPKPRGKTHFIKYIKFNKAENIEVGDQIATIEEASLFGKKYIQNKQAASLVRMYEDRGGNPIKDHGLRFERVVSVESIGMKPVYNLTAGTTNTYIANGIVTHNTGTTGKGGGAFENEWKRVMGLWHDKNYEVGFVPIFFDWTTRCSEEEYLAQKRYYYGARAKEEGIDQGTSRIQFHQHYPSTPSDMFATTLKTIIDREEIDRNLKRIYETDPLHRGSIGFFQPIYDKTKRMEEGSDVPYKIVGAEFIPTDDTDDRATSIVFQRPKHTWIDRYYQGTDPIAADTGTSLMASSIWDAHYNTVSCLVNYREPSNPNASFLQCMLAGLYYGINQGVPELLEKNIGLAYRNYKEQKGFGGNMMYNAELPAHLQSGPASDVGIDNKGHRNKAIINEMYKVFTIFGDKIYIPTPFEQLKTFVCKTTRTGSDSWGPSDNRYYHDDSIWAIVYSYLAATCYVHKPPKNTDEEIKNMKVSYETYYDSHFNLKRRPVKKAAS